MASHRESFAPACHEGCRVASLVAVCCLVGVACARPNVSRVPRPAPTAPATYRPIDTDFFGEDMFVDSVHHYRMSLRPEQRQYPRYSRKQVDLIVANFILLQNDDGGWPKNADWFKVPTGASTEERIASLHRHPGAPSTFDNRNTWSQLLYLMRAYELRSSEDVRRSFERGLRYLLGQQHPTSRGWRGADVDAVTFNDEVMVGVLYFLREFVDGESRMARDLGPAVVDKARASYRDGLGCVLEAQVRRADGTLTVWGQQHDHETLAPIKARSFEPAALTALESATVVRFLMTLKAPTERLHASIEAAMAWFEASKIRGIRVETIEAPPVQFPHRFSNKDRRVVQDSGAPPMWARFYDLKTNSPIFSNRESAILTDFNQIPRERREGYNWLGDWPQVLMEQYYPEWKQAHVETSSP